MNLEIELRYQQISDAKRFCEILNNPNFEYFPIRPKSIKDGANFLRQNKQKRKERKEFNYSIILGNEVVGAIGIKIDQHRSYIGEIGYFVDEKYWGKGIATKAVLLLERIAFQELGIKRIEILMVKKNISSQKVAIKAGYKKEGIARRKVNLFGKYVDCYVYAKIAT